MNICINLVDAKYGADMTQSPEMTTKKAAIFPKILTRTSRIAYSHRIQSRHLWRVHLEKQPASLNLSRRLSFFLTQEDLSWVSLSAKFIQLFRNIFFVSDTAGQPSQQLAAWKHKGCNSKEMQPCVSQDLAISYLLSSH
jgi:hypothetical protein